MKLFLLSADAMKSSRMITVRGLPSAKHAAVILIYIVYMHIYTHVYIRIYIYIYTRIHIYIYTHMWNAYVSGMLKRSLFDKCRILCYIWER